MHERSFDVLIGGVWVSGVFDDSFKLFAILRPIVQVIYGYLYVPGTSHRASKLSQNMSAHICG